MRVEKWHAFSGRSNIRRERGVEKKKKEKIEKRKPRLKMLMKRFEHTHRRQGRSILSQVEIYRNLIRRRIR